MNDLTKMICRKLHKEWEFVRSSLYNIPVSIVIGSCSSILILGVSLVGSYFRSSLRCRCRCLIFLILWFFFFSFLTRLFGRLLFLLRCLLCSHLLKIFLVSLIFCHSFCTNLRHHLNRLNALATLDFFCFFINMEYRHFDFFLNRIG